VAKDWQAVADAINTRSAERGLTQKALADASGVSVATLRKLQKAESGDRGKPVLMALSVALGWAPGYLQALSDGVAAPPAAEPSAALRAEVNALRVDLDDVHRRLARLEAAQHDDS
jgi:transcriptional regulator with XRE-family HTH domain